MSLVTIPGGLWFPGIPLSEGVYGTSAGVLNASNDIEAVIFKVPKTGNLRKFMIRFQTVAVAPGSGLRFSFQALTTGLGSGTPLSSVQSAGGQPAAAGWFDPGNFNTDIAVVKGDLLCAAVDCSTYTTGSVTPTVFEQPTNGWSNIPYGQTNAGRNSAGCIVISLVYDDGTHEMIFPGHWAAQSNAAIAINTGTTPDEYGTVFQPNFACRITGLWFQVTLANQATSVFDVTVYDSGGGVLDTSSRPASTGLDVGPSYWFWHMDTPVTLDAGDLIRATIIPTAAVNVSVANTIFNAVEEFTAADGGTMLYATARTNAGAWTDYNNGTDGYRKARVGFIIDKLSDDAGGGGGGGATSHAFFG